MKKKLYHLSQVVGVSAVMVLAACASPTPPTLPPLSTLARTQPPVSVAHNTATFAPSATPVLPTASPPPIATATPSPLPTTPPTPKLLLEPQPISLGVDFGPWLFLGEVLTRDLPLVKDMGATWSRVWVSWSQIEPQPGAFDWTYYDLVMQHHVANGIKPLAVVFDPPAWAAAGERGCGPIKDQPAFENFMRQLTDHYGATVKAWEFINEPDSSRFLELYWPWIGCWGDHPEEYAAALDIFYRVVKQAEPTVPVLFGGMAYDAWFDYGFRRNFLDHTLKSGAGESFDLLNVHYYPINRPMFPTLAHKTNELQSIVTQNNLAPRRLWVTETSIVGIPFNKGLAQGDYITQQFTWGFCNSQVDNIFWYAVHQQGANPSTYRWLINRDYQPVYGYWTYQNYARKISGSRCEGRPPTAPEGVELYKFVTPERLIYVAWATEGSRSITIPADTNAVWTNMDGTLTRTLTTENGQVMFEVGPHAVFVETAP